MKKEQKDNSNHRMNERWCLQDLTSPIARLFLRNVFACMKGFASCPERMNRLFKNLNNCEGKIPNVQFWKQNFHSVPVDMDKKQFQTIAKDMYRNSTIFFQDAGTKDSCGHKRELFNVNPKNDSDLSDKFSSFMDWQATSLKDIFSREEREKQTIQRPFGDASLEQTFNSLPSMANQENFHLCCDLGTELTSSLTQKCSFFPSGPNSMLFLQQALHHSRKQDDVMDGHKERKIIVEALCDMSIKENNMHMTNELTELPNEFKNHFSGAFDNENDDSIKKLIEEVSKTNGKEMTSFDHSIVKCLADSAPTKDTLLESDTDATELDFSNLNPVANAADDKLETNPEELSFSGLLSLIRDKKTNVFPDWGTNSFLGKFIFFRV